MDINTVKDKIGTQINRLPFRGMAEKKISTEAQAKFPLLGKLIPNANFIAIGLALVLVVTVIACSGKGGGGRPNKATDFSYELTEDGKGVRIKGYTGGPGKVVVPADIEGYPVTEIGREAFDGKTLTFSFARGTKPADIDVGSKANEKAGITSITIPNTVTKIGSSAFANTAITRFDMPDSVTEIESSIFSGCEVLKEVHLSDNIEEIVPTFSVPLFGFSDNKSLTKINLPKNLKRIGGQAFSGLSELTNLVIPDTLQSVEFGELKNTRKDSFSEWVDVWMKEGEKYYSDTIVTNAFRGCGKLPLATRAKLQGWGYTGSF